MNFGLSAILIICLLLPGAISIKAYYSSLRHKVSNRNVPLSELLLQGLLISFIIHSCGICTIQLLHKEIYFNFLYSVLLGKDEQHFTFTNKEFTNNILKFSLYIICCSGVSYALVKIFKLIAHYRKWNVKFNFLKNVNYWYLLFNTDLVDQKEKPEKSQDRVDFIVVDVYIKPDIIYSGFLFDFNYSSQKDELENLVLFLAHRRKILNATESTPRVSKPVKIPGDRLVLLMKEVININIRYMHVDFEGEKKLAETSSTSEMPSLTDAK